MVVHCINHVHIRCIAATLQDYPAQHYCKCLGDDNHEKPHTKNLDDNDDDDDDDDDDDEDDDDKDDEEDEEDEFEF